MSSYLPFVKSSFSEVVKLDTVRVSVVYWEGLFGTFRERCMRFEPNRELRWRVEEDSRRVFCSDFVWGFMIEPEEAGKCKVHLYAGYESSNKLKSLIESFRLKSLFKKSLQAIESAAR